MISTSQKSRRLGVLIISGAALSLTACASGGAAYQPIIDGPQGATYAADLGDCKQVAKTRNYINSDTKTSAAIGAGLGGLIALADTKHADANDFIGGAIVGALFGGGDRALETRKERKSIVLNCMSGRGHRVVG